MITSDDCGAQISAVHQGGARTASQIKWIVVHDTEGNTAEGAARWFADPASKGSTQLVVDDTSCYRTLDDLVVPWGASGANQQGLHIEQAGFASWTRDEWLSHDLTIERCAFHVADWCRTYSIPAVLLSASDMVAGSPGIATHATVSAAFHKSTHTDPGPNYPMDELLSRVRAYLGIQVTSVVPSSGSAGTTVVISGGGFSGATDVGFGSINASAMTVDSDTQITATAPDGAGTVDVTVITPTGQSAVSGADQFTYE